MNSLIENGHIVEMPCGPNFAYILSDNASFLTTEYKVLQSQVNGCFVKCMKMMYNGKIQLYYLTKGLKSFASMLPTLDVDGFLTIAANLFADIIDVKHNGFLTCQNIDISFDRIYVDPSTYKVSLVYLPASCRIHDDNAGMENELRTELVKLLNGLSSLSSPKTIQFSADLSNGTIAFDELCGRLKPGTVPTPSPAPGPQNTSSLRIVAMNAPVRIEIPVTKDEFVIGKKAEVCDGVIGFNKMISRSHCKICRSGTQFTITDLQSANGTYVNKVRLQPNQSYPIKNGDIIRLANSDFQVSLT